MKKIVALAAITLFGLTSYAQEVKTDSVKAHRGHQKHLQVKTDEQEKLAKKDRTKVPFEKNGVKLTAEQRNELKVKELTLALNLSDKQQKKILDLNNEAFKNKPQFKKGEKLSEEQLFQIKSERLDKRIAYKRSMKKILSKEQFAQWEKMSQNKAKMGFSKNMRHHKKMQLAQKSPMKMEKTNQL